MFDCSAFIEENFILNVNEVKIKFKNTEGHFLCKSSWKHEYN